MSIKVTAWVLETVKLPGDPIAKLVLIGLADHANADGTAAWPPQATLAGYADVSVRTVRTKIRELERLGLIHSGDQELVSHLPANRRPHVWDIDLEWQPGRNAASGQKDLPGGNVLPPKTPAWAEARRISGRKAVSDKPSLEPSLNEDSLRSSSDVPSAQDLVAEWIDHCNGNRPPGRVVGQIAKEIAIMLGEGIPYGDVRNGLGRWHRLGLHPSALASVVHEHRTANAGQLKSRRQVQHESQILSVMEYARRRDAELGLTNTPPQEIEP